MIPQNQSGFKPGDLYISQILAIIYKMHKS